MQRCTPAALSNFHSTGLACKISAVTEGAHLGVLHDSEAASVDEVFSAHLSSSGFACCIVVLINNLNKLLRLLHRVFWRHVLKTPV